MIDDVISPTNEVICAKNARWFWSTYITGINSSYLATLLLKLQWHTRIYEETFPGNSSSNNTKYLKFYGRKVESTRNSNFGDYQGLYQTLICRLGDTFQNPESPGLSGRVDSTAFYTLIYKYSLCLSWLKNSTLPPFVSTRLNTNQVHVHRSLHFFATGMWTASWFNFS